MFYRLTLEKISQLDRDASIALATIRERRNSFLHINRVPLEVLSLISTHLFFQQDRLRATFVCRHWRRTLLQNAALWSELDLRKGDVYVKTLLERAKGSPLDILVNCMDPISATVPLLSPHTKQIGRLHFVFSLWADIQKFLELNSGPLPLLHALMICNIAETIVDSSRTITPLSPPLFSNAVNLQEFRLHSESLPLLNHFVFPSLTFFELSVVSQERFRASQLLDFLEASPMLQVARMRILTNISLEGVPRERVVILHKVELFYLVVSDGEPGYKIATHMSCPSAKDTSLTHRYNRKDNHRTPWEIFPTSVLWNAIVRQYTRSGVEEVTFQTETPSDHFVAYSLTFRSPDATTIELRFEVIMDKDEDDGWSRPEKFSARIYQEVFYQASRTIQDLPLLADVKRLRMSHSGPVLDYTQITRIANEVGRLLGSVGPLEESLPFLDHSDFRNLEELIVFPPIKEFTISHPQCAPRETCVAAIMEVAKSQHALGIPFERITVHMDNPPAEMAEKLRLWVGTVHCYDEPYGGDQSPI